MSVPMSERHESKVQFLDNAIKLRVYTIQQCKKMYKKDKKFCGDKLDNFTSIVLTEVKSANSIYPVNRYEAQLRRNCWIKAYNALQSFLSELTVLLTVQPEMIKAGREWAKIITDEMALIKGIMKSDRKRYSNLPCEVNPYIMAMLAGLTKEVSESLIEDNLVTEDELFDSIQFYKFDIK